MVEQCENLNPSSVKLFFVDYLKRSLPEHAHFSNVCSKCAFVYKYYSCNAFAQRSRKVTSVDSWKDALAPPSFRSTANVSALLQACLSLLHCKRRRNVIRNRTTEYSTEYEVISTLFRHLELRVHRSRRVSRDFLVAFHLFVFPTAARSSSGADIRISVVSLFIIILAGLI